MAKLISLEGAVETKRANEETWHRAALKQGFCTGDTLRTGYDSRAAVRLTNETLLRLDGDSALTFTHVEKKTRSIIDLLLGAVHFISRTPKSLEVRTPYVNASIEGTEFVVQIKDSVTDVTVFEGLVVATNTAGSIELAANQAAHAANNQAPVRITKAIPLEAVTWALYYPPLPEQPDAADTLAQQTITAIAQNRIDEAAELAKQARVNDSQSAAAYMAQSYVDQAQFNIPAALANSQKAAELTPQSALTQARLAEVWLMTGDTRAAQQAANQAVALDPKLSLSHAVLGFASLREVNLDAAMAAFEAAISLDSAAPLPRLGLGLVKIRRGDLQSGREEIETATLLDPGNALLRSYMGKAYYEEKRNGLASEQFAIAKALDPNDPTAWFYDSILLQSENRPVEALQAQQQAIKLNDNRGVYRSRQLLDQDGAARNTAVARIYSDLGFEKLAITEGAKALSQAPDNFSAHRFMSDINAAQPQSNRATDSELLQSKLLQPLNAHSLRPELSELKFADGPARFSYNEFNPLFTRSGPYLLFDGFVAGNSTWGEDLIATLLQERFSISLGQYHYESDGFRELDWLEKDTQSAFAQFDITPNTMVQFEYSDDEQENGDLNQHFFSTDNQPDFKDETEQKRSRVGFRHTFSNESILLANYSSLEGNRNSSDLFTALETDDEIDNTDIQWIVKTRPTTLVLGGNHIARDAFERFTLSLPVFGDLVSTIDSEYEYNKVYFYSYTNITPGIELTLASSYTDDTIKQHTIDFAGSFDNSDKESQFNPKIGLVWDITDSSTIRTAFYRSRPGTTSATSIEPSQIAGFNQIYDDYQDSLINDAKRAGIGFDSKIRSNLSLGFSALYAELNGLFYGPAPTDNVAFEIKRELLNTYLYYEISNNLLLNAEYEFEKFEHPKASVLFQRIDTLKTHRLPITLRHFFSNHLTSSITGTYYNQDGLYTDGSEGKDDFWIFDASITYNLPKRLGKLSIGARNLFDKQFNYEDKQNNSLITADQSNNINELSSERIIYGKFSIHF
ncbi:MAG: FecR domain-containing protein [Candidatus Thiodiazotropha sp. (ex Lucinoma kastoroae)]|nr:FecR domain-containing protein [Candidatus Thiodiazotropha sp. (ex Lucinoma kastoroae)]